MNDTEAKESHEALTTREAWKELARWWKNPQVCGCGCGRMTVGASIAGLCSAISIMRFRKMISEEQEKEMLDSLPRYGPVVLEGVRSFIWPTDAEGAKERVKFCLEQAGILEQKKPFVGGRRK
jgi:hypothetical protein